MSRMGPVSAIMVLHLYQTEISYVYFALYRVSHWNKLGGHVEFCGLLDKNFKCAAVSNRPEPEGWCDHENSTGVKFLRDPWLDMTEA